MFIPLIAIGGYYINGYFCLFIFILLVVILLIVIGGYFINDYLCLFY
jgi:hypothetical protein